MCEGLAVRVIAWERCGVPRINNTQVPTRQGRPTPDRYSILLRAARGGRVLLPVPDPRATPEMEGFRLRRGSMVIMARSLQTCCSFVILLMRVMGFNAGCMKHNVR